MKDITVDIKISNVNVRVIICDDIVKVFNKGIYLRGFYCSLSDQEQSKIYYSNAVTIKLSKRTGGALYYMIIKKDLLMPDKFIAHECFHLVMRIEGQADNVNMINSDNEEKYAYLLQEAFQKISFIYRNLKQYESH